MDEDTKEFVVPNNDNEIIEIGVDDYKEDLQSFEQEPDTTENLEDLIVERKEYDAEEKKLKKPKTSLKDKWNKLSKKGKIILVSAVILLIVLIIIVCICLLKKDDKSSKKSSTPIILEKENYRYENGVLVLLNENDVEIGKYECVNKNEKICHVAYSNNDNFDEEKYEYEDGSSVDKLLPIIGEKYAFIIDGKNTQEILLYNIQTKEVEEKYTEAKSYKIDSDYYLALSNKNKKYGLYKLESDKLVEKIPSNYDYLGIPNAKEGIQRYVVSLSNNRYNLLDFSGKEVSKKISSEIKSYNNKYIVTADDNNNYQVVDYNNNKIFNNAYDFITLENDLAIVIKDGKLNAVDYNENKLLNSDIALPSAYYNKTYVYDKTNKPLETKESFWIINNDNNITIEYYDEKDTVKSSVINVYESLAANKYEYVSYYDGILYFYSDEGKTNLIGKYKCTNKNNINSSNATYDRCYIAKEANNSNNEINNGKTSLGELPIIYNKYVFINDSIDNNTNNIVLYDLTKNKTLGTYQSVDAGIYTMTDTVLFENNDVIFIGLSAKKQKYGLIKITENEASSILSVGYDSIERIGKYYEAEKSGTYQLYDANGTTISEKIGYKIINFSSKYLKCEDKDKFAVADYEGNTLSKGLSFVDIQSSYYVTLNSENYIVIHEDDKEITSDIHLSNSKDYVGVTKSGSNYDVKYKDSDGVLTTTPVSSLGE